MEYHLLKIQKIAVAFMALSLLALFLTACSELDTHDKGFRFTKSEEDYRTGMRWGEWDGVLNLIRAKPESLVMNAGSENDKKYQVINIPKDENKLSREELIDHLSTIKVKQIEVLSSSMGADGISGQSRFMIQYRIDNSAKIQKFRHKVSWWYDKDTNIWFSETPLPKEFEPPKADPSKRKTIKLSPDN